MDKTVDIKAFKGLTQDSRAVQPGYLFAALQGGSVDGRDYIDEAVSSGAVAVLAQVNTKLPENISLIEDENPRRRFSLLAAEFYGLQPDYIVAVTGTNGKTSTVHFAQQLWSARGIKAASMGTLSYSMTTPDAAVLHEQLAGMKAEGIIHLAMEASSHGLDQYRLDGARIKAAGFTNLSRDHLDYHGGMDEYFAAKMRLFSEILEPGGVAVLNAGIGQYNDLCNAARGAKCKVLSYGFGADDLKIVKSAPTQHGQLVRLEVFGREYDINFPLAGEFQLMNALCALGLVLSESRDDVGFYVKALERLEGVPGRLQYVAGHPENAAIYIDYAHTPDALENVLKALRPHIEGQLVCLFGCGGDRDRGKRSIMGSKATEFADLVIVTDDNPRSEDPDKIRRKILEAAPDAQEIGNRSEAIKQAVSDLNQGDVLVIAGKGHEQGQVLADNAIPLDDYEEATRAIKELGKT